jgi:hypothetical protein
MREWMEDEVRLGWRSIAGSNKYGERKGPDHIPRELIQISVRGGASFTRRGT